MLEQLAGFLLVVVLIQRFFKLGVSGGVATEAKKRSRGFEGDMVFKVFNAIQGSLTAKSGFALGDLVVAIDDTE